MFWSIDTFGMAEEDAWDEGGGEIIDEGERYSNMEIISLGNVQRGISWAG